ncbi:MAG: hypothetical protein R3B70_21765 [Polyangiaceae bacterium]
MSTESSHLLKADEQRLKVAVLALSRGGRLVVVVAGDPVWESTKELLARELPGATWAEFTLTSGDEVMRMFASPAVREPGIVVLHVGAADRRAMHALNLNRDKLTRQACQFVLRLAGREAQERFAKEAADAYSVRDALAFVEGWTDGEGHRVDEDEVERLVREAAETDDPERLLSLAERLGRADRWKAAHAAMDRGIATLGLKSALSVDDRRTLSGLHLVRRNAASDSELRHHSREAVRALEPVRDQLPDEYALVLAEKRDAIGADPKAARAAIALLQDAGASNAAIERAILSLAIGALEHADFRAAHDAFAQIRVRDWMTGADRLGMIWHQANLLFEEGRWEEAERRLRAGVEQSALDGYRQWFVLLSYNLAGLLLDRGECEAALRAIPEPASPRGVRFRSRILRLRAAPEAIAALGRPLQDVLLDPRNVEERLAIAASEARAIREAADAGLIEPARERELELELQAFTRATLQMVQESDRLARANVYMTLSDSALPHVGGEEQAREAAENALREIRDAAPELVPWCTHPIAIARLRSGDLDGLTELLQQAASISAEQDLLSQAAKIAALGLWHATLTSRDISSAETALHAAIERSGSVLVEAQALHLAGRGARRPDLLERARRIYRSLPWPEREALCLEALGQKQAALARLDAFGLKLPLLAMERRAEPPPIVW